MPNFRKVAMLTVGILAGNFVFDQWILRSNANPNGFVEFKEGFGLDDVTRAAVVAPTAIVVSRLVK